MKSLSEITKEIHNVANDFDLSTDGITVYFKHDYTLIVNIKGVCEIDILSIYFYRDKFEYSNSPVLNFALAIWDLLGSAQEEISTHLKKIEE